MALAEEGWVCVCASEIAYRAKKNSAQDATRGNFNERKLAKAKGKDRNKKKKKQTKAK